MMTAPIPSNETHRLRSLQLYRILDTASDQSFDDLARLASLICDTPIGLISLVDGDRPSGSRHGSGWTPTRRPET